jgi:hypothetical protein
MFIKEASYYRQVVLKIPGQPAPGNQTTNFVFDDQPDIRNARVIAIEAYFSSSLETAQPAKIPVVADVFAPKLTLYLETNDPDDLNHSKGKPQTVGSNVTTGFTGTLATVQWIPLARLNVIQGTVSPAGLQPANSTWTNICWMDRYVLWQKSSIVVSGTGLGNTTDVAVVLGVYYSFLTKDGKAIVRQ